MANKDRAAVQSGLSDILGNVINSDRRQSGRREDPPAPLDPAESNPPETALTPDADRTENGSEKNANTTGQYDNNTLTQDGVSALTHYDSEPEKRLSPRKRSSKRDAPLEASLLEDRIAAAHALAKTPTTTITLRIPHGLNDWLDEYVHGAWPEKVKKQHLVTEALQILYARRGRPKEEIVPTELLAESDG